jgi:hypothetical protein
LRHSKSPKTDTPPKLFSGHRHVDGVRDAGRDCSNRGCHSARCGANFERNGRPATPQSQRRGGWSGRAFQESTLFASYDLRSARTLHRQKLVTMIYPQQVKPGRGEKGKAEIGACRNVASVLFSIGFASDLGDRRKVREVDGIEIGHDGGRDRTGLGASAGAAASP